MADRRFAPSCRGRTSPVPLAERAFVDEIIRMHKPTPPPPPPPSNASSAWAGSSGRLGPEDHLPPSRRQPPARRTRFCHKDFNAATLTRRMHGRNDLDWARFPSSCQRRMISCRASPRSDRGDIAVLRWIR